MQDDLTPLRQRGETLETRLNQHSTTANRPPSSDHPSKKPRQRSAPATPRKAGGQPGPAGHRQVLLPPPAVHEIRPERCAGGHTACAGTTPYYTHQVIELPPIAMNVTRFVLHQGWCTACGTYHTAQLPPEHAPGYGPRFSALRGAIAGIEGTSRRTLQGFGASVLGVGSSARLGGGNGHARKACKHFLPTGCKDDVPLLI